MRLIHLGLFVLAAIVFALAIVALVAKQPLR